MSVDIQDYATINTAIINAHIAMCRNCRSATKTEKQRINKYVDVRLLTDIDIHRTVYYGYAPIGLDEPEVPMTRQRAIDSLSLILATKTRIDDEVSIVLEDIKQWLESQEG